MFGFLLVAELPGDPQRKSPQEKTLRAFCIRGGAVSNRRRDYMPIVASWIMMPDNQA